MHIGNHSLQSALVRVQQSTWLVAWGMALAALVVAVGRQWFDSQDATRCNSLLNSGVWADDQRTQWQPDGCMLRTYDQKSTPSCLHGKRVVLMGDSIVRQLYYSIVTKVMPEASTKGERHSDIRFVDPASNMSLEFFWDPYLNDTDKSVAYLARSQTPAVLQDDEDVPFIFLVGSGLWYLRYKEQTGGKDTWIENTQTIIDSLNGEYPENLGQHIFMSPIPAVNPARLNPARRLTLLPTEIKEMNDYLHYQQDQGLLTVPFVWTEMTHSADNATRDGLHYRSKVMTAEADILLNYVCNNQLPKVAPMGTTCCYDYPANTWNQSLMLMLFLVWIPIGVLVQTHYRQEKLAGYFPSLTILKAMAIMAGAVTYMYYADRSSLFAKANKMYTTGSFTFLMVLATIGGLATLKTSEKDQPFLNRDQTDEWKGWMQIVILIYHYVGASSVSSIYNPVRVLVASYLFMTGFGHFIFFYKKADFGFVRVASILARLNLLTILLTYTMNVNYLAYYFAPLVSFFYMIIYITMYIGHQHNQNTMFMSVKIVVAAIVTAMSIHIPLVIDTIFDILQFVFGVDWNAAEWRFRLQLDVWIVFGGMLFAFLFIKAQDLKLTDHEHWPTIRRTSIAGAGMAFICFVLFEGNLDKFTYNGYHPFVSWIPIMSYVILRNATRKLRNTSSTLYIFIGKCSLETFIGQFHMWLAGDTKGILIISPFTHGEIAWWTNLLISTVVFVTICYYLSVATGELSDWLITGREPKVSKSAPAGHGNTGHNAGNREAPQRQRTMGGAGDVEAGIPLIPREVSALNTSPPRPKVPKINTSTKVTMPDPDTSTAVRSTGNMMLSPKPSDSPTVLSKKNRQSELWLNTRDLGESGSAGGQDSDRQSSGRMSSPSALFAAMGSSENNTSTSNSDQERLLQRPAEIPLPVSAAPRSAHPSMTPRGLLGSGINGLGNGDDDLSFATVWSHPVGKCVVFFSILWVMNYFST